MLFLDRQQRDPLLDRERLIGRARRGDVAFSAGRVSMLPRIAAMVAEHDEWLGAMPAYVPPATLVTKLVTVFPGNARRGRPTHQALTAVFDAESGIPRAPDRRRADHRRAHRRRLRARHAPARARGPHGARDRRHRRAGAHARARDPARAPHPRGARRRPRFREGARAPSSWLSASRSPCAPTAPSPTRSTTRPSSARPRTRPSPSCAASGSPPART
ncbi:MAG: hypothetical protein FJZ92_05175 [Chloroflexi bacterium]|nr:hypothetical protein [Chloroflexota bacterium]